MGTLLSRHYFQGPEFQGKPLSMVLLKYGVGDRTFILGSVGFQHMCVGKASGVCLGLLRHRKNFEVHCDVNAILFLD